MNLLSRSPKFLLLLIALLVLTVASGCSSGSKVKVPILVQSLPANSPDTPVDLYWTPRSIEEWLQLPGNPEKAPDLDQARIVDSHTLWEIHKTSRKSSKVADLEVSGQIHLKHPREWLLLDLGTEARRLGAHGVVINSLRVAGLSGHASRDDNEALWTGGLTVKVWVYAQAVVYD